MADGEARAARRDEDPGQAQALHALEARRLAAMRANDAAALEALLAPNMVYIHESGRLYHREAYLSAIASHALSYHEDVELSVDEATATSGGYIGFGVMRGHGLLDGEQQVFHLRYSAVWISDGGAWRLALVHKTPILSGDLIRKGTP